MNRKQRRASKDQSDLTKDPMNELFLDAVRDQTAGRLAEAEQKYLKILALDPRHGQSLHMMGLMALDLKGYDIAEDMVRRAIAAQNNVPSFYNSLGSILKAKEKFEDAVTSYQQCLALKPDYVEALNNMGVVLEILKKPDQALDSYKRILAIDPHHLQALNNIGVLYESLGKYDEAIEYYKSAIKADPKTAAIHFNLGNVLKSQGRYKEALDSYGRVLEIDEVDADALNNIGIIYEFQKDFEKAEDYYKRAIANKPDFSEAYFNCGNALKAQGKFDEALLSYAKAAETKPHADAHAQMGVMLHYKGRHAEAIEHYKKFLEINPHSFDILNGLGITYATVGNKEDAIKCYQDALKINPGSVEVLGNLASAYKDCGLLDEAIVYFKEALALAPQNNVTFSNLLLAMIYASSVSPDQLTEAAHEFDEQIAKPLRRNRALIRNKNPDRKLRIGYISPDFRDHAVNYFFEPLLQMHDRDKYETYAFSNTLNEDGVTERLQGEFDHWRNICFLSNDAAADLIEEDQIDILVDLAGHTAHNRLLVLARKPAPIQVSWLGYPATTGMSAFDYRISDVYAEPPGMTEHLNVETLWRLPDVFCAYQVSKNETPVIDHPPFEDNGYITFGCFNNFAKVTDPALQAWAKIMAQVPRSRLILEITGIDGDTFRSEVEERLRKIGLPTDRVILEPRRRWNQYVLYNKIDIALDPFPCTGGTTSMDTLWMGVPLLTLAGHHFLSRIGVTLLENIGMPELIGKNTDQYIEIAVNLANDLQRLKTLRHGLRGRMQKSPLMDYERFTRNMEDAYRGMWRKWCESQNG